MLMMCSFSHIAPCVMPWPSTKCFIFFTAGQVRGLIKPNVPYHSRPPVIGSNAHSYSWLPWGPAPSKILGTAPSIYQIETVRLSPLLDKFNRRISNVQIRLLLYAGRMELISSVLTSLSIHWSSAFRLPEKILKSEHSGLILVRPRTHLYDQLVQCRPKDEGGLGLRTIEGWNRTAMLKLFWRVVNDNGSIWTPWVNYRYLRRHSIWVENIPSDCS